MVDFHTNLPIRLEVVLKTNCSYLRPLALSQPLTEKIQTTVAGDNQRKGFVRAERKPTAPRVSLPR